MHSRLQFLWRTVTEFISHQKKRNKKPSSIYCRIAAQARVCDLLKWKVKPTVRKIACQVTQVFINKLYRWIYRCRTDRSYQAHASIMRTGLSIARILGVTSTKSIDWLYCLRLVYLYKLPQIHTMHTHHFKVTTHKGREHWPNGCAAIVIDKHTQRGLWGLLGCLRMRPRIWSHSPPGAVTYV